MYKLKCPACGGNLKLTIGYDGCDWDSVKGEGSGFGYEITLDCFDCPRLYAIGRLKNEFHFSENIQTRRPYGVDPDIDDKAIRKLTEGVLIWDASQERPDIKYADGSCHGGLHSGDNLLVHTREGYPLESCIEYTAETGTWYIPDIPGWEDIFNLAVKKI